MQLCGQALCEVLEAWEFRWKSKVIKGTQGKLMHQVLIRYHSSVCLKVSKEVDFVKVRSLNLENERLTFIMMS